MWTVLGRFSWPMYVAVVAASLLVLWCELGFQICLLPASTPAALMTLNTENNTVTLFVSYSSVIFRRLL